MLDSRSAHDRLMVIVVDGVCVGDLLKYRRVALEHIQETHRVAAGTIIARDTDKGVEVVEAASWITSILRCVLYVAIRLLPHVEQAMHHVARIAVIGKSRTRDLEYPIGELCGVGNAS